MAFGQPLNGLCLRVWVRPEQDLVLIYADPVLEDLKRLLASCDNSHHLLEVVKTLIWELSGTRQQNT